MQSAARAFPDNRHELLFRQLSPAPVAAAIDPPWQIAKGGELPPIMFQLRFQDGRIISFAYGDLREIHYRDAGHLELRIRGMQPISVTIQGRHLRELAEYLGSGMVYWLQEADERDVDTPEAVPCVISISILPFEAE
jgi:hypothetical protein